MEKPQRTESFPGPKKAVRVIYTEDGKGVIKAATARCNCCGQTSSTGEWDGKKRIESKWRAFAINRVNRECEKNRECKRIYPDMKELDSLIGRVE